MCWHFFGPLKSQSTFFFVFCFENNYQILNFWLLSKRNKREKCIFWNSKSPSILSPFALPKNRRKNWRRRQSWRRQNWRWIYLFNHTGTFLHLKNCVGLIFFLEPTWVMNSRLCMFQTICNFRSKKHVPTVQCIIIFWHFENLRGKNRSKKGPWMYNFRICKNGEQNDSLNSISAIDVGDLEWDATCLAWRKNAPTLFSPNSPKSSTISAFCPFLYTLFLLFILFCDTIC